MKTRIALSIMVLILLIANANRSYHRIADNNPFIHAWRWYLAHNIIMTVVYFGLFLVALWSFPERKK